MGENRQWIREWCIRNLGIVTKSNSKVVCNENQGGWRKWRMSGKGIEPWRSSFICLLILPSSFLWCFSVSAKSIINRRCSHEQTNGANCFMSFFLPCNEHCLLTHRIVLHYKATRSEQRKKSAKSNFKIIDSENWTTLPINARCLVAPIYWCRYSHH
jgi:hypothetical protein